MKHFFFSLLLTLLTVSVFPKERIEIKKEPNNTNAPATLVTLKKSITAQKPLNVLLFTALPASGKSEVRKYLDNVNKETALKEFGIGDTIQFDDFPYVHMMRLISNELINKGLEGAFFRSPVLPFKDAHEWGTLIQLINLEYEDVALQRSVSESDSSAEWIFDRIDKARARINQPPVFSKLAPSIRRSLASVLEKEAAKIVKNLNQNVALGLANKTVVIEFSRGGASASAMPLPAPYGYNYALSQLSPEILEKASIFYIQVAVEDSLEKNTVRSNPNDPGSILNHKVPLAVMYADYGCDDMFYLKNKSSKPHTVSIQSHGKTYLLPIGIFDNRDDKTTFVREDKKLWKKEHVAKLHTALQKTFSELRSSQEEKDLTK